MANTFILTYDANGGMAAPEAQSITTDNSSAVFTISSTQPTRSSDQLSITATCYTQGGSPVTAPSYTKYTSFSFESWNDDSSGSGSNYYSGGSITLSENKTIYAKWSENVSYTTITLPYITRSGYSFLGWYSDFWGGTRYGGGGKSYTPTADTLTMYAVWYPNRYTIWYDANGGIGGPSSQEKTQGVSIKLSTDVPTFSGHSFLGWATSSANAQSGRVAYAPGAIYSENANATLYAVWQKNYVLLYFDPDQYSDQSSGTTLKLSQNGSVKLPGALFTRDGRVQSGWIRNSDNGHFPLNLQQYNTFEEARFTPEWSYPPSAVTATNGTMGSDTDKVRITIEDNGQGYRHYVYAIMDSVITNVASGTLATTLEFKPDIASYAPKVPYAKGGTLTIRCQTVNTYQHTVGITNTTCYISVPDTVKCTVGSIALAETVSGINEQFGGFVQGKSKAQVTITGDTSGAYGATVVGYSVGINGDTSTDNPYTTGVLRDYGTNSVTATVTDTRGYSDSLTQTYSVYPWYAPSISATAERTTTGAISLHYTWDIAPVNNSNTKSIKVSYRPYGSSSDPTVAETITPTTYSGNETSSITGLSANTAYEVYVEAIDFFTSIVASTMAPGVDGRIFHMSSTDRTVARHGANPSDGWDHQFFDERFHGDVGIDGDETVGGTLDVTGATTLADTTVNGVLDITPRRCEATLSAAGWYRAIVYNAYDTNSAQGTSGEIVTIKIVYTSQVSVQHEISLWMSYGKVAFLNETSHGTTNLVDKIRYTYAGAVGYVDIHIASSSSVTYNVSFEVASRIYAQGGWVAGTLASVDPSPSGETILTEYTLNANGAYYGNVTVGGVLDVTPRRAYASLSSAGWYRILKYSGDNQYAPLGTPSFIVRFGITRHASTINGEAHEITMTAAYNGSVKFSNEISNSNALIIDKIRYTYSGNNAYVDIHYNNSGANIVNVDFDVDARLYVKQEIVSQPFTQVTDSPTGETVLTEYTFAANTEAAGTVVGASGFTPAEIDVKRSGRVVYVHFYVQNASIAANTNTLIGTLSGVPLPKENIRWLAGGGVWAYNAVTPVYAILATNGNIAVTSPSAISAVNITISYIA